jgi:hypothetical protein
MAPDARARMIQLVVKHAAVQDGAVSVPIEIASQLMALQIVSIPGHKPIMLGQDRELIDLIDGEEQITVDLDAHGRAEHRGVQILLRSSAKYQPDRLVFDCLALRAPGGR